MKHIVVTMTETVTYEVRYTVEQFAERMAIEATSQAVAAFLDPVTGGDDGSGFDEWEAFEGSVVLDEIDLDEHRTLNEDREWGLKID